MVLLPREDAENTCTQNILGIFTLITSLEIKFKTKKIIGQDTTVKYYPKKRADTTEKPHFPVQGEICEDLINWLCAACGGGMSSVQAKQIASRVMKFLKYCCEDDDDELSEDFVDYCLGLPNLIITIY